jgi:hypothetical protein
MSIEAKEKGIKGSVPFIAGCSGWRLVMFVFSGRPGKAELEQTS